MKKTVLSALVLVLAAIILSAPAFAGGPDGVIFQLWAGNTSEPTSKDVTSIDCTLGSNWSNPVHTNDLYIEMNGQRYSGYDLPYPTDEWHPMTWFVYVDISQTSTLRTWSSAIHNPNVRYGVHGTNMASNEMVFHRPVYEDMITTVLDPGKYYFTATASLTSVPEPGSFLAIITGLAGLGGIIRRKN